MMYLLRYALPAWAAARIASASCSASATLTVQNAGDASAVATCTTYSGSIAVATGTTDTLNFAGVKVITGDLSINGNSVITNVGGDSLQSVGGSFSVRNCQILSSLSFPQLTSVSTIDFEGLPNLNALGFTSNIAQASTINIQNTFLSTLDGINTQVGADNVYIANNRLLQDISFQFQSISQSMTIESNGDRLTISFPNLVEAQNITFRDIQTISIPSLHNVTGSLGFFENSLSTINAPNLTGIGGTLGINTNTLLTNISLPVLKSISGGLQIQNNSAPLSEVSLPALTTVGGETNMYGNFTSVSLPALKDNRGSFNIQSSLDISSSCAVFASETGTNNVIKGKYLCAGKQSSPGNSSTTPTTSGGPATSTTGPSTSGGSGGRSSGLTSGAKAGIGIGISLGFVTALAALYFCIRQRRRSRNKHTMEGPDLPELSAKEKKRFEADSRPIYEADKGQRSMEPAVAELPTHHSSLSSRFRRGAGSSKKMNAVGVIAELSGSGSRRRHEADSREIVEAGPGRENTTAGDVAVAMVSTSDATGDHVQSPAIIPSSKPVLSSDDTPGLASSTSPVNVVGAGMPSSEQSDAVEQPIPAEDLELERLRQEMGQIQEERAREERLRALSNRELELRRAIEAREKSKVVL